METRKLTEIVFREDLYPRLEPSQKLIQQYAYSVEFLPPITISEQNILIDGYHRWKAHEVEGKTELNVNIVKVASEKELKQLAYKMNSNHGSQLSQDEKRKYAVEMIGDLPVRELVEVLQIDERTISRWTKSKREELDKDRDRKVIELYLRAWNTQEKIAEMMGIEQSVISRIIKSMQNGHLSEMHKDFKPQLYNIWNLQKQDNAMEARFGSFPNVFMENLLHYHTDPLDIVFDPMAGGGTTVDACKKMFRRYYCTDRKVTPGREADIRQFDIKDGLPEDLPKPKLVFLDPPYSILAKGEYAEEDDKGDLGNVSVEDFYKQFNAFVLKMADWKVKYIAYLIRPFWVTGNGSWQWSDPTFEMYSLLSENYSVATRYVLPYSSQQYTGLWVNRAKEQNKCLILNRELTIFEVKNG